MKSVIENALFGLLAAILFLAMLLVVVVFYLSLPFVILVHGIVTIIKIVLE